MEVAHGDVEESVLLDVQIVVVEVVQEDAKADVLAVAAEPVLFQVEDLTNNFHVGLAFL